LKAATEGKSSAGQEASYRKIQDQLPGQGTGIQALVASTQAGISPEHHLRQLSRPQTTRSTIHKNSYVFLLQKSCGNRSVQRILEKAGGTQRRSETLDDTAAGPLKKGDHPGITNTRNFSSAPPTMPAPGLQAGPSPPIGPLAPDSGSKTEAANDQGTEAKIDIPISVPSAEASQAKSGLVGVAGVAEMLSESGKPDEAATKLSAPVHVTLPATTTDGKAGGPAGPFANPPAPATTFNAHDPTTDSALAMPQIPAVAEAAKQVLRTVEIEKAAFSEDVQAHRAAALAYSESKAQAIAAKTTAKIQTIIALINGRKAELSAKFAETRTSIMAQVDSRKAAARADGSKALASLQKEVESKRKGAIDAAEETASQTEKTAQAEADRAINEGNGSIKRVNTTAAEEGKKYGTTAEGKAAAAQAIQQVAAGLLDKIRTNANDQAKKARDTAGKVAQGLRDSGKQLSTQLGGNTAQVEQTIKQSADAAVTRVDTIGKSHLESLKGFEAQALASLDKVRTQAVPGIQKAGDTARAGTLKIGHAVALETDAFKASALQQMTKGGTQVVDKLRQVEKSTRIDKKAVAEAAQGASQPLRQGRAQMTRVLQQKQAAAESSMASVDAAFGHQIDGAEKQLNGAIGGVATSAAGSLAQLQTELHNLFDQALNAAQDAQQKAVAQYVDGLEHQIGDAKVKWGQERDKVLTGIRTDVDKNIATQQEIEQKATAEFAKAGKEAAEEAEGSVVSGILKGIGKIVLGLVILFALAGLIYAVAAGLAALGICAAIPFAVALVIAAVVLLVVAFVLAVIQRTKEMDSVLPADRTLGQCILAGFAVVFIALGDVVGITPIIEGITGKGAITQKELTKEERSEKITEGVLTLLLIFIGGRAFKGLGDPDPVVDPLKGADPTVDPSKPVDPTVDPRKPTDPNKPEPPKDPDLGFENGKRVMAEEPTADGKHKIKITEDGECLYCTNCGSLTKEYAIELDDPKNADVLTELDNADKMLSPKFKAKRMAEIEEKLAKLRKDNPHPNDPKLARAARIRLLARDPADGLKVSPSSLREAEVAVSLEEGGQVQGPIQRDPSGAADFIDGNGTHWDVKGLNSHQPKANGGFDLATDTAKIDNELGLGENVMVDTAKMTPGDVAALKAEGAKPGHNWGNRVKFFP
jgi:hypothetical protein